MPSHDALKAQLRSDSGRSSNVITDREAIEAVVEVPGAGELVLRVDSAAWTARAGSQCGGVPKVMRLRKLRKARGGIC